ncbi:MAG: metal ABC transporter permease [Acutalibacteraceae bacterium]
MFYNRIFAVTFDENFARATGTNAGRYNAVIALLTASTIVVGMKMMGTLLISSLIIFPALTSMRLFKSFKIVVVCSGFLSVFCFFIGMALTVIFEAPAGASVVIAHIAFFLIFSAVSALKKIRKRSIEINE